LSSICEISGDRLCCARDEWIRFGGKRNLGETQGNHPAAISQLRPAVHANPAMELHLTVVFGIHDQAKLDNCSPISRIPRLAYTINGSHQTNSTSVSGRRRRKQPRWFNG